VFEQPGAPLGAGVGKLDRFAQYRTAGLIPYQNFHRDKMETALDGIQRRVPVTTLWVAC
jgi:hypothetical protein